MAAKQNINWSELRAAAIALQNVNEAAKRAAINLPEPERQRFIERVNKRSQREQWISKANSLTPVVANEKPLSKNVQSGSDLLQTKLAEDRSATKLAFSKASRKVAEDLSECPVDELKSPRTAISASKWVGVAAQAQGWDSGQKQGVQLNILAVGGEMKVSVDGQ